MKYYTYEEVKALKKGTNLIVMTMAINKQYMGVAENETAFPIKAKTPEHLAYEFLVCCKVLSPKGNYLVPIGYSDEFEWIKQEDEFEGYSCN